MKPLRTVTLVASLSLAPAFAAAQGGGLPVTPAVAAAAAADSAKDVIRNQSIGGGYSVDAINQGVLNQARAYGASTGFFPVSTTNSSLGSSPYASMPSSKPFSNITPSSTVSPYLNLFNQGPTGRQQTLDNYNLLVRPMLNQQSFNAQAQRQQQQMNMRVQAIAARPDFEFAGSKDLLSTGHQTGFGYYSHFYPGKSRRPVQQR